jgi:hypothetical protein
VHEIRATVPPEHVAETARLAHGAGIDRVANGLPYSIDAAAAYPDAKSSALSEMED